MWSRIRSLSLRNKLMVSIVACLLLPFVVSYIVSNWLTQNVIRDQVIDQNRESLQLTRQYVDSQLQHMLYVLKLIADNDLQLAIVQLGQLNPKTESNEVALHKQYINDRLETALTSFSPLYLTVLLPNQELVANYTTFQLDVGRLFEKAWYQEAKELPGYQVLWIGTEPSYIPTNVSNTDRSDFLSIGQSIRTGDVFRGVAVVSLEADTIRKLFAKAKPNQELMIVDKQGRIVLGKESDNTGTPFRFIEQLPQDGEARIVKQEGHSLILQSETLSSEWSLVSLSSYEEAVRPIEAIRRSDFLIQALLLSLFTGILLVIAGALTKPLRQLLKTARQIESGQLSERSGIGGQDEVGTLGTVFDRMLDNIEEMLARILREQEQRRKAELDMLQAQINPHFLFNVLNSIRLRILMRGDQENAELISSLSSLLRMTINRNNEFIPLREELAIIQHYVRLVHFRYARPLELRTEASSEALPVVVPRLLLQPLIENAYQHGLRQAGGEIFIQAEIPEPGRLEIVVADNGEGMSEERLAVVRAHLYGSGKKVPEEMAGPGMSGIGLRNVYERIRLIYGEHCKFNIYSSEGEGTRMFISFYVDRRRRS